MATIKALKPLPARVPIQNPKSAIQNGSCGAAGGGAFVTPFDRCRRLFLGFVVLVSFVVFRFVRPMLREGSER